MSLKPGHWEEKYRANTIPWDRGGTSPALHDWIHKGLLQPGRILIPGCGRGHEAIELAKAGFEVTALDLAPTALQWLQHQLDEANLQATLVCDDALSWQPAQPFDFIYEQTCLCALDPGHWTNYEQQLHAWLKPSGQLLALFMQTNKPGGPPHHCDLPAMQMLFHPNRWDWTETPHAEVPHPNGWFEYATILHRR
jgi:methyl halide transferase